SLVTQNATTQAETGDYEYSETLVDGHIGATYKINEYGNVYFSYATSSDINGGESDVGTNSGYGGLIILDGEVSGADPEHSELYELGTKWNLMDERLLLTAALFQIDKTDVMEGNGYDSTGTFNSAENRVKGIEVGMVGQVTERLTAQAGLVVMDAEVKKAAPRTLRNEPLPIDITGKTLSNFADESAFAQLKYAITDSVAV